MLLAMSNGRPIRACCDYAYPRLRSETRLPTAVLVRNATNFAAVQSVFWMISTRARWRASWDSRGQRIRSALG
jgi:hypothetical protein